MSGRKGRSGPPRNLNAVKHPWRALWRRGLIRPQDRWVERPIADVMQAFASDLPDLTAREREVIETVACAKGCELLIRHALQQTGMADVIDGRVHIAEAHEALCRFMKLKLDALRLLPAGRRAKITKSLHEYLREQGRHEPTTHEPDISRDPQAKTTRQ